MKEKQTKQAYKQTNKQTNKQTSIMKFIIYEWFPCVIYLQVLDSVDVATEEVMVVPSDKTSLLDKMPPGITSWTYIRTTLAALFVSGILIMGILVRIYVPVKDSQMTVENITYRYNTTYTL